MTFGCDWLAPRSLEEALALKAEHGEDATVLAGGTFLGILINQRLFAPTCLLSLGEVPGLDGIEVNGELRLGAMVRHRAVERSGAVLEGWPVLASTFALVASPGSQPGHRRRRAGGCRLRLRPAGDALRPRREGRRPQRRGRA